MRPEDPAPRGVVRLGASYVHTARGMTFDGHVLTLLDLAPATVFVRTADSTVGHLSTGDYLDRWHDAVGDGPGTTVEAVVSLLDAGARMSGDAVVSLALPRIVGTGLEYHVAVRTGTLPPASGTCVVYVDPPGTPVTPVSRWVTTHAAH